MSPQVHDGIQQIRKLKVAFNEVKRLKNWELKAELLSVNQAIQIATSPVNEDTYDFSDLRKRLDGHKTKNVDDRTSTLYKDDNSVSSGSTSPTDGRMVWSG